MVRSYKVTGIKISQYKDPCAYAREYYAKFGKKRGVK